MAVVSGGQVCSLVVRSGSCGVNAAVLRTTFLGEADGEPTFDRDIDVAIPGQAVAALLGPDIADVGDEVIDVMPPSEETSRTKLVGFPGGCRVTCAEAFRRWRLSSA